MNTFTFGNPNLFAKGTVEQIFRDPTTGNIVGYDNVASDASLSYSFNLGEITGALGNKVVGTIPDTTRLTGTYTSQAFSLKARALVVGNNTTLNGVAPVCETITATASTLTVTKTPALAYSQPTTDTYAWCYVNEHGATTYTGANYGVDMTTKTVQGFTAVSGKTYDVRYFTAIASAEVLALPTLANPSTVSITQKYAIYAMQNGSVAQGTLAGYLYVEIPLAILSGDAGMTGNQTSNSTTANNWTALSKNGTLPTCDDCGTTTDNYAYYIYVPCGGATASVDALAVVGGGVAVTVASGTAHTAQIPVKYVIDNQLVQPVYTDLTYSSADTSKATVSTAGVVTGVAAGTTTITITLTRTGLATLTTTCNVTVTAS